MALLAAHNGSMATVNMSRSNMATPSRRVTAICRKSKQPLATLPLEQLILLPFTHEDAVVAASLDYKPQQKVGGERQALKDDFKIIGHARARNYGFLITDDAETMFTYCEELKRQGRLDLRAIKLQAGFSLTAFTPDDQSDFTQVLEEAGEYSTEES